MYVNDRCLENVLTVVLFAHEFPQLYNISQVLKTDTRNPREKHQKNGG